MTYVVDLHLHSRFARGTSKHLTLENLAKWAKIKGIDLLASCDFSQPVWFEETRAKLRDTGDGLFERDGVKFVLGTEVNCNAEQGGRNRRVHILVFAPSFETVEVINTTFGKMGKLEWDGRPTLHVTPRDLLETLLEIDDRCFIIPAHLWTPWFGLYGSKSGFDSLEECFGDLTGHIHAIETGLSSDPAMNWQVPSLDDVSIMSFSDAHSLEKMGRELTAVKGEPSYDGLLAALKSQDLEYTTEFFPHEGKYHHSGHRKCGVRFSPAAVAENGSRCPKCGRPITLGVLQRVEELAGRTVQTWTDEDGLVRSDNGRPPFRNLVGLQQVVAEALGVGQNTKKVRNAYAALVEQFDNELTVLTQASVADLEAASTERIAEGVARVRAGDIAIEPGYDGQYGSVKVWPDG